MAERKRPGDEVLGWWSKRRRSASLEKEEEKKAGGSAAVAVVDAPAASLSRTLLLLLLSFHVFAGRIPGATATAVEAETCSARRLGHERILVKERTSAGLETFVYPGMERHPLRMFADAKLVVNLTDQHDYSLYQGPNCTSVLEAYDHDQRLFGFLRSVELWRSHSLDPFATTYVGVSTKERYAIGVKTWKLNIIRVAIFFAGVLLFLFARRLVRNALFYYTSGCTVGLLASLLIIVFFVYKVAPKKTIGIPILFGGWSVSAYLLWWAWQNVTSIVQAYQNWVIGYFATVLVISFAVCYRRGPPTDARSHDLAQWALQIIAFALIFATCQIPEVSLMVMGALVLYALTKTWLGAVLWRLATIPVTIYLRLFPPRVRLLTREEYERQTEETTRRELRKLQEFCRSPEANSWKIAAKVHNPSKFARFVEGEEDHVSEDESVRHEMSMAFDEEEELEDDEYWDEQNREEDYEEREWRGSHSSYRHDPPSRGYDRYNKTYSNGGARLGRPNYDRLAVSEVKKGRPASARSGPPSRQANNSARVTPLTSHRTSTPHSSSHRRNEGGDVVHRRRSKPLQPPPPPTVHEEFLSSDSDEGADE